MLSPVAWVIPPHRTGGQAQSAAFSVDSAHHAVVPPHRIRGQAQFATLPIRPFPLAHRLVVPPHRVCRLPSSETSLTDPVAVWSSLRTLSAAKPGSEPSLLR